MSTHTGSTRCQKCECHLQVEQPTRGWCVNKRCKLHRQWQTLTPSPLPRLIYCNRVQVVGEAR